MKSLTCAACFLLTAAVVGCGPHGPLKYIQSKPGEIEPESEYGRILRAVADFVSNKS